MDIGPVDDTAKIKKILNDSTKEYTKFWKKINDREMILDDRDALDKFGNKLKIMLNNSGLSDVTIETVPVKVVLQWKEKKIQVKIKERVDKLAGFVKNVIKPDEKKTRNKNIKDEYTENREQIVYSSFRLCISISWK